MGRAHPPAIVLDAGALIALEKGARGIELLMRRSREAGRRTVVPAGVLAQVWRDGATHTRLAQLMKSPETSVEVLDEPGAKVAGQLCGFAGTSDVIDATVVIAARRHDAMVITSDPDDLARLDPGLVMHAL